MQATLIVISGPTAVGKTNLAIDLALHLNTEIISTDSRQFYREMNIGTAKPKPEELASVPHHFINNCSVTQYYSAGNFEKEALSKVISLFEDGKKSVIAIGGSGLYSKALCEGLDEMPEVNHVLRSELIENYEIYGISWLQEKLKQIDAEKFDAIDSKNPHRLMRSIELYYQGGIKKNSKPPRPFRILKIGLELPREELYGRINLRVDNMIKEGLLKEVESLLPFISGNALQTVGYSELFDYFKGETDLKTAVERIKQHTRNYAKRQMTWYKADPEIKWFNPCEKDIIKNWVDGQLLNQTC